MYQQLLDKGERKANFESGMAMVAAGLSGSPEARSALMNMAANSSGTNAQSQAASTINTLMQLRQLSQAQTNKTAQQARLPAIAQQLNLPLSTVQYLDSTGKLDDLVTKAAQPDNEIKQLSDGRTVLISKTNQRILQDFGGQKTEDKDPKQIALLQGIKDNWQSLPGVPDPNSTDPKDQQWWKDNSTRILAGGSGVNVSVNNTPEKAEAAAAGQAIGGAKGKEVASYIEDGKPALAQSQLLDTMSGALKASNGQYSGPFADYVLNGKQALAGAFGLDLNTAPQETAQKLGFQLATQASKAISSRPSQAEFLRALQNVPGIFQTQQGANALISINKQEAQDRVALANLAHNVKPGENMNEIAEQYYKTHPIMSPFHPGESFGQNDINMLAGSAAAAGQKGASDFIKPAPSPAAIANLKAHPETQSDFDAHFGTGTSFHYLHGQ
jgi:hypothetical protein